jgi:hypothetical protein
MKIEFEYKNKKYNLEIEDTILEMYKDYTELTLILVGNNIMFYGIKHMENKETKENVL